MKYNEYFNETCLVKIKESADILSMRKTRLEMLKKNTKLLTSHEFSAKISDACEELNNSIKSLEIYYRFKLEALSAICTKYNQGELDTKEKIIEILKEIICISDDFTRKNYFMKELQYGSGDPGFSSLTKDQLTKISSRAEILEIGLSKLANLSTETEDELLLIFTGFKRAKENLEVKCTETIEFLREITNKLFGYKQQLELTENKAVQTNQKQSGLKKVGSFFSGVFSNFRAASQSTDKNTDVKEEDMKEKEARFTMLRK